MPRAKRGFKARRRHNRILKHAQGFHSARSRLFAYAKEVVMKSWVYAYAHRRAKKRDFRRLWTVRINAAAGLIAMGMRQPPSEYVGPLELAKQLVRARAALNSDDAEQDMAAGRFYLLTADPASAVAAFQTSLKLDPKIQAQYLLGSAYAAQGNLTAAKQVLEAIPAGDPQYEKAQRLLQAIAAQAAGHD